MRYLDGLQDAAQLDLLMAPIKLAGVTWQNQQGYEGFGELRTLLGGFPAFDEALHAVISAAVADFLQTLK